MRSFPIAWPRRCCLIAVLLLAGPVAGRSSAAPAGPPTLTVSLAPGSAYGQASDGITASTLIQVIGQTQAGLRVNYNGTQIGGPTGMTVANGSGQFGFNVLVVPGANLLKFSAVAGKSTNLQASLAVFCWPLPAVRPYDGSPTSAGQPFARLIPNSKAYAPGLPPRQAATQLSQTMVENPNNPQFSRSIVLGLVFYGQFVDHDVTLNDTAAGQGPSISRTNPVNLRTPALDLDSVYGSGPHDTPEYYAGDGLSFLMGVDATDYPRNKNGVAIIPEARNDENGQIENIQLAFEKYHNLLIQTALNGVSTLSLNSAQKDALFAMVRNHVIGFHQGLAANTLAVAFTGQPVADGMAPLTAIPVEFAAAVYRLGHTLVPNTIVVNFRGGVMNPTSPLLRGPGSEIPYALLFGPRAQPAAAFDALLSMTMHTLLIPMSPFQTAPSAPDMVGGNAPNIGQGQIIGGVMHLDLAETNILRGREQMIPSGEEYLAMLNGQAYNPLQAGNTDLFVYMLKEAAPFGHLGRVGSDVFHRTIGGILAADNWRYTNPQVYTPEQTALFKQATFEMLLQAIGTPGF